MNDISIVTAFFDIGRSTWTTDKGLPHYLYRPNETYLERFSHLAKLENEMFIFTTEDMVEKIAKMRGDRSTHIMTVNFHESFQVLRNKISEIQKDPEYQSKINPSEKTNPEYWSADYVLVNLLKSSFVNEAIKRNIVTDDLIAWLDFGYCRTPHTLNGVTRWQYPFNKDKIHFFNIKEYVQGSYLDDIIFNNDVHIAGPCIVAGKEMWPKLENLVKHNLDELFKMDMIDDDQTLLLMSYISQPELFELHPIDRNDWFVAFREYNMNEESDVNLS